MNCEDGRKVTGVAVVYGADMTATRNQFDQLVILRFLFNFDESIIFNHILEFGLQIFLFP